MDKIEDRDGVEFNRTDRENIESEYQAGSGCHPCPKCGQVCDIEHNISEFGEYIYCDECRMKFTRSRVPLVEDEYKSERRNIIITSKKEKSNYVEYRCYECNTEAIESEFRVHERTKPEGEFEPIKSGMQGYDECSLVCPCGERHRGYLDIGEKIDCDCGRVYQLSVTNTND